jgi:protein O-GlcNAc transferase
MSGMTLGQRLDSGFSHYQAGRLAEAERIYREILAQQPNNPDALHLLGMLAGRVGQSDAAVELIRRATSICSTNAAYFNSLGNALKAKGQLDQAIASYRQAIGLKPEFTEAHNNLGTVLSDKGQLDAAIESYRHTLVLKPDLSQAHNNLGNALRQLGQLDAAIDSYRQAIRFGPDFAEVHNNLGAALLDQKQIDEAIAAFRQAIRIKPDFAEAHSNLGNALNDNGQLDDAIAAYAQAIRINPDYADAYYNLGNALKGLEQLDEAIACFRQALRVKPDYVDAHNNLGNALSGKGQYGHAMDCYRQAITIDPHAAEAHSNLGNALKDLGQLDQAIASYRQAVRLKPDLANAHSNLLYALQFHPGYDPKTIFEEHRRWNQQHAVPLGKFIQPHANDRNPDRRLRIGYVSPDFRDHVVGQNLSPLLREHDHLQTEIFCYANMVRGDAFTEQIRGNADAWRSIARLSDSQVVDLIRQDQIDILVDLSVHTAHNRLLVFARKPAPVQVSYLGYCSTTGLETMDYRLSDPYMDPPDSDLSFYSEKTIRLPETYWCFNPRGPTPAPSPPPVKAAGFITFGCLNNFAKASPTLELWAEILQSVPRSRLIVHSPPGPHLDAVRERFAAKGIGPDRLEFPANQPWPEYLRTYGRIDIALDPFPWGGGITTCDALWTGVPVVSLVGRTAVGRGGASILANLGLPELIAKTPQQYVHIAAGLASDSPRLAELRRTLRSRMEASPLMDAPRFARNVEAVYRQMWRNWCSK